MKKMTKEELQPHLDALNLQLVESFGEPALTSKRSYPNQFICQLSSCDIELIPEKPEINIKNLGKFMAKFGEYPEAKFSNGSRPDNMSPTFCKLSAYWPSRGEPYESGRGPYKLCEIYDKRWTKANLDGDCE